MRSVDRFCVKHSRFGIPNLMIYIVIGNAIVWLFGMIDTTELFYSMLYFDPYQIFHGQVWRLVTFILVPESSGIWLLVALYFYYFIGSTLERQWGTAKFNIYYLFGVLLTVVYGILIWLITGRSYSISATYINLSMFFSFATLYPETQVLLFFFIPVKIKWLALLNAVYFFIAVITNSFPVNLIPVVAVLNYLLFCGDWLFAYLRPARIRQKKQTIDFKNEVRRMKKERNSKPYRSKCSVCGRTDTDYPNLEFRYCSRCEGYHCFCEDHINNHVHFKE